MRKVAILSLHLSYGGIEKSVSALANLLAQKYDVEIICTYKIQEEPAFEIDSRIKIRYLVPQLSPNRQEVKNALRKGRMITFIKESYKAFRVLRLRRKTMVHYIKNSDADIIISTRDIFNEWLGEYASSGVLKIGWEHNHYHGDYRYARGVTRSSLQLDYLVLVSDPLRKFYKKELSNSKCRCVCIPNIIESIPDKCATLTTKRLISVGRLSPEKGYLDLLKIYNNLVKRHPDWKLDIVGDGVSRDELENYIKQHNLEDYVTLHGYQGKDYIDKLFQNSSIYLMTSYTESFGIVLIEAMSHGLPCIAFDSAEGARELITSGMNGYLIKHRNFSAMVKKIEDLMESRDIRKKIGMAGRKSVGKYTSEVVQEQWFKLLEK